MNLFEAVLFFFFNATGLTLTLKNWLEGNPGDFQSTFSQKADRTTCFAIGCTSTIMGICLVSEDVKDLTLVQVTGYCVLAVQTILYVSNTWIFPKFKTN